MNKFLSIPIVVTLVIIVAVIGGALYTVDETQQVVITQFGEPIGEPIRESGLHFKIPIIQKANYFDKRILNWDGDPNQIPTRDKRYIWVDTTARWKIVDALKFMQSVGTEAGALGRLDDVIDAATRDAISNSKLVEAIRNSNRLIELSRKDQEEEGWALSNVAIEKINVGREKLTRDILKRSSEIVPKYGIELVDVRIKRINYVKEVQNKVYERMISERNRAAEQYRSEGQGKKAEIEGQMGKELKQITSEAYRKAQEIKGKAEAEATKIYADAYNKDPDFYSFIKTLDTYKETIDQDTTLMLNTESDFYGYLKKADAERMP